MDKQRNGAHRVDGRRRLQPRDYLTQPDLFGEVSDAAFVIPDGGDRASMEIAHLIHRLICRWRHSAHRPSGAALGRRFGFSRQTMSHIARGYRWPGHTVLAAILIATGERPPAPRATPQQVQEGQRHATGPRR